LFSFYQDVESSTTILIYTQRKWQSRPNKENEPMAQTTNLLAAIATSFSHKAQRSKPPFKLSTPPT